MQMFTRNRIWLLRGRIALRLFTFLLLLAVRLPFSPATAQDWSQRNNDKDQARGQGPVSFHQLLLCTNGALTGWGRNTEYQLSNASAGTQIFAPTYLPINIPRGIVSVATGSNCSFAIDGDGNLWSWGSNINGVLGAGSPNAIVPNAQPVSGIRNVITVSCGFSFTLALCADGTVWSWGDGSNGELGTGTAGTVYTPQQINPQILHDIRAIACGASTAFALDATGQVWSWGANTDGVLGNGSPAGATQFFPKQIPGARSIRTIIADEWRALAITINDEVYDWGRNTNDELGLGNGGVYTDVPSLVGRFPGAVSAAMTGGATILVINDGSTFVWGDNGVGQFGISSSSPLSSPVPMPGTPFSPNVQIRGQGGQFLSIERTGGVKVWGYGNDIPLGYTPTIAGTYGGSCVPTQPNGACNAVPDSDFPVCGPMRAYFQRPGANYVAAQHGYTVSPAEVGAYGQLTTIDASQAPYYGKVIFDGIYHLRGDVELINGSFVFNKGTVFYVDRFSGNGSTVASTVATVRDADAYLVSATLQGSCGKYWQGIVLDGNAKLHAFDNGGLRPVIRDAVVAIDASSPTGGRNTNEYYLNDTDFLNNQTSLRDVDKGTALAGEGAHNCTFRDGIFGIELSSSSGYPNQLGFAGDYYNASFDGNKFDNLDGAIYCYADFAAIVGNAFTNCYQYSFYGTSPYKGQIELRNNTIVLPLDWSAAVRARYGVPTSYVPTIYGVRSDINSEFGTLQLRQNTIQAVPSGGRHPATRIGVQVRGDNRMSGNAFQELDLAVSTSTDDYVGSQTNISQNSFVNNGTGVVFQPEYRYNLRTPTVVLGCNTFDNSTISGGAGSSYGVKITNNTAFPSSLGSVSAPGGNKFLGWPDNTKKIVNDANALGLTYNRYNSSGEDVGVASPGGLVLPRTGGGPSSTFSPVSTSLASPTNACSGGPGINARPVPIWPLSATELSARLDSLRVPGLQPAQQHRLMRMVCAQPTEASSLAAIEMGINRLSISNLTVQQVLGLHLLHAYERQGKASDSDRLYAYVWQRRGDDAELTNYLRWYAASRHAGAPSRPLAEADRVLLREAAVSATTSARPACNLLRFYEPTCRCVLQPEAVNSSALTGRTNSRTNSIIGTALGTAYPNPARTLVHLPYKITGSAAQLVCYDLLGRRVYTQALSTGTGEAMLPVQGWAEGLYLVTLVIDGQVTAQQRVNVLH